MLGMEKLSEAAQFILEDMACTVEQWVKQCDPRAAPYIESGAVAISEDGRVRFDDREKFIQACIAQGVQLPS